MEAPPDCVEQQNEQQRNACIITGTCGFRPGRQAERPGNLSFERFAFTNRDRFLIQTLKIRRGAAVYLKRCRNRSSRLENRRSVDGNRRLLAIWQQAWTWYLPS